MSNLHSVIAPFAACNLHRSVYAALGLTFILRGACSFQEEKYEVAREHWMHGIVYLILGTF